MVEYVTKEKLDRALRKQERNNLKNFGKSLSWVSMYHKIAPYIEGVYSDTGVIILKENWREYIKTL